MIDDHALKEGSYISSIVAFHVMIAENPKPLIAKCPSKMLQLAFLREELSFDLSLRLKRICQFDQEKGVEILFRAWQC